jgi:hypothetical protein
MSESYPLSWPEGWKRSRYYEDSRFKTGFGAARNLLFAELEKMGAQKIILSTNIPLRNDGLPRANVRPDGGDSGVAVYFERKGRSMVLACDKYRQAWDNIYAIAKTIEAMRGIERWGAADMMERAFTGFSALPAKASSPWREILNVSETATMEQVDCSFRALAKEHHPDAGGEEDKFRAIIQAREDARKELGASL